MDTSFVERRLAQLAAEFWVIPENRKTDRKRAWARVARLAAPLSDRLDALIIEAAETTPAKHPQLYFQIRQLGDALAAIYRERGVPWLDERSFALTDEATGRDAEPSAFAEALFAVTCRLHGFEPSPRFSLKAF